MYNQSGLSRREVLKGGLTTAALCLGPAGLGRILGANDDIRVAVVGFRGRGRDLIRAFSEIKGSRVVALCDCDMAVLEAHVKAARDRGLSVAGVVDVRRVLDRSDIDVIATATPNHWHALLTIWACQAGKDVYVEKPVSHNIWEGRQMVLAARRYGRIVQAGTQSRSSSLWPEIAAWLSEGHLGRIRIARGLCYKPRPSIGKVSGPQPVPPTVDYDLWCGPAEKRPLMRRSLHYDWHWFWNTGNGDLGNQGVHQMDIARWVLGKQTLPNTVVSIGGRLGYVDDGETANTQMVVLGYDDVQVIFEVRGLPQRLGSEQMDAYRGQSVGNVFECDGGYVSGNRAFDTQGRLVKEFPVPPLRDADHCRNFLDAVRSRKAADLFADIEQGHISSAMCHMGNISYRLGRAMPPEALDAAFNADRAAQETLDRMKVHLQLNGVDLKATQLKMGPLLRFDPKRERFVNSPAANALLRRTYRKGFVVPARV